MIGDISRVLQKLFKSFHGIAISTLLVSVAFLLLKTFYLNLNYLESVKALLHSSLQNCHKCPDVFE